MAIRVYQYGLLPPTENADLVDRQLLLAHRYRNLLTEIERDRRTDVRAAMASHADVAPLEARVAELQAKLEAALQAIKDTRRASRSKSDTKEQREAAQAVRTELRELRATIKASRAAVLADPDVRAKLDAASERAKQRVRDARAACGVYWGTYLLQEADIDRARQEPTPPKFMPWRGEGRVSVQLQGGLELENLWGADTQLSIGPVSEAAWDPQTPRGIRRRAQRTVLHLRVGSDERRKPVWSSWPMVMHRPLPAGAVIKVATVNKRRRDSISWAWTVCLTVDVSACAPARATPAAGVVALNLGFAIRPNGGLRSGYLVGDDGWEQEVLVVKSDAYRARDLSPEQQVQLNTWIPNGLSKAESIRSFRDKNLNAAKPAFLEWRARVRDAAPADTSPFPEWFTSRTETVHAWLDARRFRDLSHAWAAQRFDGDQEGFEILRAFTERDEHLECYEAGIRRSALRDRRESYRLVAAMAARRYRTLLVPDIDLTAFQRSPSPDSERDDMATAIKYNQRLAAGSELRLALINAFGKERTVTMSSKDVTRRCHVCSCINLWDRAEASRNHTCSGCGARWDQDANACINHLKDYEREMAAGGGKAKEAAPAALSRSDRLRSARATKAKQVA